MHQNRVTAFVNSPLNPRTFVSSTSLIAVLLGPLTVAAQTAPAAAPVAPALTAPGLVAVSTIQGADTAWLMVSTALVLLDVIQAGPAMPGSAQ